MSFFRNPFKKLAPQQNTTNPFSDFHTAKGWVTQWEPGKTPSLNLDIPYAHIIIAEGPSDKTTVELEGNPDEFAVHRRGGVFSIVRIPPTMAKSFRESGHGNITITNSSLAGNIAIGPGATISNNNAIRPAEPCRVFIKTPKLGKIKAQLRGETVLTVPVTQQEATIGNDGVADIAVVAQTLNLVNKGTLQAKAVILGGFMNAISEGFINLDANGAFDGVLLHLDGESTINTSGAANKYRVDGAGHGTVTHQGGCPRQHIAPRGLFTCDIK